MLVVNPANVSVDNSTGGVELNGLPLESVTWKECKDIMASSTLSSASPPLFVILLLRTGEPMGLLCERVAEIVNKQITTTNHTNTTRNTQSANRFRFLKVDVSNNNDAGKELGIKTLPCFLMMQNESLLYAGTIGGKRKSEPTAKPRVLLVEPDIRHQIEIEKCLKRAHCEVSIALSVQQAMEMLHILESASSTSSSMRSLPFELVLLAEELQSPEVTTLGQRLGKYTKTRSTVVCALVSVLGQEGMNKLRAVIWDKSCSEDISSLINPPLSHVVSVATQKPLKTAAITKLLSMSTYQEKQAASTTENTMNGLTPNTLLEKMNQVLSSSIPSATSRSMSVGRGTTMPYVGIRMSAEDIKFRGTDLVPKNISSNIR